jgi:mRNA-degrading endonuclease RelE of RelBE toxin-antitoxin system
MKFEIKFAELVRGHFKYLTADERARILRFVEKQFSFEPLKETRNRKRLRPNPLAPWELRVGNLRAFYEVTLEAPNVVRILAVGKKEVSQLLIAGKVVKI